MVSICLLGKGSTHQDHFAIGVDSLTHPGQDPVEWALSTSNVLSDKSSGQTTIKRVSTLKPEPEQGQHEATSFAYEDSEK